MQQEHQHATQPAIHPATVRDIVKPAVAAVEGRPTVPRGAGTKRLGVESAGLVSLLVLVFDRGVGLTHDGDSAGEG